MARNKKLAVQLANHSHEFCTICPSLTLRTSHKLFRFNGRFRLNLPPAASARLNQAAPGRTSPLQCCYKLLKEFYLKYEKCQGIKNSLWGSFKMPKPTSPFQTWLLKLKKPKTRDKVGSRMEKIIANEKEVSRAILP